MTLQPIPHSEHLIVVVGPSGAGKDSVLGAWRKRLGGQPVAFAQRVVTRPPDPHEPHEAMGPAAFQHAAATGEFATWWSAHGLHYGVRWRELMPLAHARWVVLNGSRVHLPSLRRQAPSLHAVEITAPPELRARRLALRDREDMHGAALPLARQAPAEVALTIHNDAELPAAVDALHA
jgi:phosphonate metabolism protein PhnN/1,5-bisphosphokinase (PRPP-forming)